MRSFKKSYLVLASRLISGSTVLEKDIPRKTIENLKAADQEEANTANRYQLYAEKAKSEAEHLKVFQKALKELGNNHEIRFYVGRISGDTIAVPVGKAFTKSKDEEYIRVG